MSSALENPENCAHRGAPRRRRESDSPRMIADYNISAGRRSRFIMDFPGVRSQMSNRHILSCLFLLAAAVSCSRDPNAIKARYLQNGNKYFEKGKYKEASIMYRTALQKDQKFGEAYYRLALTELKTEQPF